MKGERFLNLTLSCYSHILHHASLNRENQPIGDFTMHDKGTHLFPAMERVDFGRPAAQALAAEADRLGSKRVFLIVSRSLNTKTDEIAKITAALGENFAGLFDGVPQHT